VVNVLIGDGRIGQASARIRKWIIPARAPSAAAGKKTDVSEGN
jgi:hypothetical protein